MDMNSDAAKEASSNRRRKSPFSDRAAKRPRLNNDGGGSESLPPEAWAGVMEYLPFRDILSCAATSRSILRDAIPLLTKLRIDRATEINLAVASRFRDVTEIHINSLLSTKIHNEGTEEELTEIELDLETKIRLLPFLTKFDKLKRVVVGGKTEDGEDIEGFAPAAHYFYEGDGENYPHESERDRMMNTIDLFSGAFCCGALPRGVEISGLCCPDTINLNAMRGRNCEICLRACRSFPLESVVCFESGGSSISNARSGRCYGLDVCLENASIESIIESRPGGKEMLRSEERLLRLLSRGRRYDIELELGKPFHIVKYTTEQLSEIKRVIEYAELDVKKLSVQKVHDAIARSFARNGLIPPKDKRYLSELSLCHLRDKIGLDIALSSTDGDLGNLVKNVKQIAGALAQCQILTEGLATTLRGGEYRYVEIDCLGLIHRFLEMENPPIEHITESGLVPILVKNLNNTPYYMHHAEAVSCLKNILVKGTEEQRELLIGAGVISSFVSLLYHSGIVKDAVLSDAVLSLSDIITRGKKQHTDALVDAGGMIRLADVLHSKHDICVRSSLVILTIAVKDHTKKAIEAGLPASLCQLIKSSDKVDMAPDCIALLRKMLESDDPPIQRVIDLAAVPKLIEIMKESSDTAVQADLAHVMVDLASGIGDQTGVLVKEAGFLSVLASLVNSPDDDVAKKAISAIGRIANDDPEHCQFALQAGVSKPLLQLLERSSEIGRLKIASKTYAKCCRGKPIDFASVKVGLKVMSRLLENEDNRVVSNSCWALFHLLNWLNRDEVNAVIGMGFVKPLLRLVRKRSLEVRKPALKTLYFITTNGDACIKAIVYHDGLKCFKKALSSQRKTMQKLACCAISNIIAVNKSSTGRLSAAIDSDIAPCLMQILASKQNKNRKHALWFVYQVTMYGTANQIEYLVAQDCVDHLCDILLTVSDTESSDDFQIATCHDTTGNVNRGFSGSDASESLKNIQFIPCAYVAIISALKKILSTGIKEAKPTNLTSAVNLQVIENKLAELTNEYLRLEREHKRVALMLKKKAWLEVDAHSDHVQSLESSAEVLLEVQSLVKEHNLRLQKCMESVKDEIKGETTSLGEKTPVGQLYRKLNQKGIETKKFLDSQTRSTREKINKGKSKLVSLLTKAEKVAPKGEWNDRLTKGNLPVDLTGVNKALGESRSIIASINDARKGNERKLVIDAIRSGLRSLFRIINNSPRKKRRWIGNTRRGVLVEINAMAAMLNEDSKDESENESFSSSRKQVQANPR